MGGRVVELRSCQRLEVAAEEKRERRGDTLGPGAALKAKGAALEGLTNASQVEKLLHSSSSSSFRKLTSLKR
ncbi:hypothetical protein AV530_004011 [Patagioenas fasciata monilis]|uniref:Uncharacterized protein n=1 Tax=Patagioenas fasciata monilis TaxID=372326 RepID=A0A1V4JVS4_PATFA|nr:hypothetical protein AV530_004011 [Patagioenas fasciata monilis]